MCNQNRAETSENAMALHVCRTPTRDAGDKLLAVHLRALFQGFNCSPAPRPA